MGPILQGEGGTKEQPFHWAKWNSQKEPGLKSFGGLPAGRDNAVDSLPDLYNLNGGGPRSYKCQSTDYCIPSTTWQGGGDIQGSLKTPQVGKGKSFFFF